MVTRKAKKQVTNILNEHTVSMADVPTRIEQIAGFRPGIATVHRWHLRGVRGVKLETVKIGKRRLTSTEALKRFWEATQEHGQEVSLQSTRRENART